MQKNSFSELASSQASSLRVDLSMVVGILDGLLPFLHNFNFIMALLQSQMTRYYDDMRPRITNPTYASTNVGTTIGMHLPFIQRSIHHRHHSVDQPPPQPITPAPQHVTPVVAQTQTYKPVSRRRSSSTLSNYGTHSLKSLNRFISDKEVYEKQQKNYNIISAQPKQYEDTIKLYPKYRLENSEGNYQRKMKLEKELADRLLSQKLEVREGPSNPQAGMEFRAGTKRGKYLNNVDEVRDII